MLADQRLDAQTPALSIARLRLFAISLALTLLVFSQSSGFEAADTKLDLVVDPVRFLRKSLSLWDPTAAAGQLQDQAYGYLFPMGPFFVLGHWLGLAPWVVQRGWESALIVAAFLGVVRLAGLLGVRGFWPRVAAGLAYALAPRMLAELGVISSELLPMVVLPWVLIPLVRATEFGGSARRAAAWSGVALLFAGGINASATLAILPVPALWLLTRTAGRARRVLAGWWVLAVGLSTLWWVIPLVILGKYSPPFLDWIESSAVTTKPTSLIATLRGVDHWQSYLGPSVWPGGWILVSAPAAILATTAVAALALAGLSSRQGRNRLFLLASLGLGIVLVTLGHVSTIGPPFAGSVRLALDGSLNAFRNVHKFDPVLRLPLAIGVGFGCAAVAARTSRSTRLNVRGTPVTLYPRATSCLALLAIAAVAITPALAGRIVPQTRSINDPVWWKQTGQWLGSHDASGRALVVPGAAQPSYVWGEPRDDALQPYADGPWTVRDAAPLTQPGYIRLLDTIESTLAAGRADPTLPTLLARAGISYLVVRNDLDTRASGATALRFVHATIAATSGFTLAARFGPDLTATDPNKLVDLGLTTASGSVQIYRNTAAAGEVSLLPADGAVIANGSTDSLADLTDAGLGPNRPVIFGSSAAALSSAGATTQSVLTDGIRRRAAAFSGVDRYSATMTATQPFTTPRAAQDYLPAGNPPLSTVAYSGAVDITASSSGSNANATVNGSPANSPYAAFDADPQTAWMSASLSGAIGQWLQIELPDAITIGTASLQFAQSSESFPSRIRVTTDSGSVDEDVAPDDQTQQITLPAGPLQSLRITVLDATRTGFGSSVGIATLALPHVTVSRTLDVPGPTAPDVIAFEVASGQRSSCLPVGSDSAACDPTWAAQGEEDTALDRSFLLTDDASYQVDAGLRLLPSVTTDALLDSGNPLRAIASSTDSNDPRERPGAAVDGDLGTGWVASAKDRAPTITVSFAQPSEITGIVVRPMVGAPVTNPTRVQVTTGGESFSADVPADGEIPLPRPVVDDTVTITVLASTLRASTDSLTGTARLLPVGIGEIQVAGASAPQAAAPKTVSVACGFGPDLVIDGRATPLQLQAVPAADVLAGNVVHASICGSNTVRVAAGSTQLQLAGLAWVDPVSVRLSRSSGYLADASTSGLTSQVRTWTATSRTVAIQATGEPALLVVRENANAGWTATLNGHRLTPVMTDGWEQGYVVPAGSSGVVHLSFTPQRPVAIGLLVGALAVLGLLALAFVPARRLIVPAAAGRLTRPWDDGVWILGAVLAAGLAGLLGGLVVAGLRSLPGRRPPVWAGPGALLAAGVLEASAPADSAHPLADSIGAQLLVLIAILLTVWRWRSGSPAAGESTQQRPLDQVPAEGSGDSGRGSGQQVELDEVPGEGRPAHPPLDGEQ